MSRTRRRVEHVEDYALSLPLDPPIEDLASASWLIDSKGAVVGANRAAREIERDAGQALPLFTPASRPLLAEGTEVRRALEDGRALETWARGPGERRRRLVLEPLRAVGGAITGALLVAPECGSGGRSLLRQVLGRAVRELQDPLAPLATFAALAGRASERGDASCARRYLDRLHRHLHRLDYLVGEMRELLTTLTGDLPLRIQPFDLAALVRDAVDQTAHGARAHVFEIHAPGEGVVMADRERIAAVLDALLSNAVRFSPGGGRVRVDLTLTATAASVAVTDDGEGVPADQIATLFDGPCAEHDVPRGGLGLGLFLAREVIEQHGGAIRAEPSGRGGTRIVVTLCRVHRG